jgi:trans-aconitate methyltransferase
MQRMKERSNEEQLAIHLENDLAPIWENDHGPRIERVRDYISAAIASFDRPVTIVDLGVGSGDTSGPFSNKNRVIGIDLTNESKRVCAERFPRMEHILSPIEEAPVVDCDILVACEVLEHLADPVPTYWRFTDQASAVVIGHPLNEPDPSEEFFHLWRYDMHDFSNWFSGHPLRDFEIFAMGGFPEMVVGWGRR